jgi:hypothetical protein
MALMALAQAGQAHEATPQMMTAPGGTWNQGDWIVNIAGSGTAYQTAGQAMDGLLLVGLALAGLWLVTRK